MARAPASTMKLLPTWAALDLLGPAYAWKTRAWSDVPVVKGVLKGNLYLQGGGDPLLTIERWWRFVNDLRQTGLRVIEGDIVIDQTRFTAADERPEDFDGKFWRTYNVLPDAMLVNWQSSDFTIRPSDDGSGIDITIQPFPEGLDHRKPCPARDRPLRRPQQPGCLLDRAARPGTRRRNRPDCDQLRATDAAARDHGAGAIRVRNIRDTLAPAGRPVPGRDASRTHAPGSTAPAHARIGAACRRSCASPISIRAT